MSPQRVYVTGGTGFVGRHVCRILVELGCEVVAIVRTGSASRLPSGITRVFEVDDVFGQSAAWWTELLTPGSHVLHLAWIATPGKYLNDPVNLTCLSGTTTMAAGAIAAGVTKVTGIGTCIEYRMDDEPLDITAPLDPRSPYAGAKAAAFLALSTALDHAGIDFAWCRLFYLFGEGEHPGRLHTSLHDRLSKGQKVLLSEGTQVRDFMDVRDGASQIVSAALGDVSGPVNICSGQGVTVRALATEIAEEYGRLELLKFGARPSNPFDPASIVGVPTLGRNRSK